MKMLIIYGSKHGSTEDVAKKIAAQTNADIVNIEDNQNVDVSTYDTILIGSSIYVGQMNKVLKKYLKSNVDTLKSKNLYLFLCRGQREPSIEEMVETNIPEYKDLFIGKMDIGGEFRMSSLGFMEKKIIKVVSKGKEQPSIQNDKVDELINQLKNKV